MPTLPDKLFYLKELAGSLVAELVNLQKINTHIEKNQAMCYNSLVNYTDS